MIYRIFTAIGARREKDCYEHSLAAEKISFGLQARVQNDIATHLCYSMYKCNSDRCKPVSVAWNNAKNSPHTTTYSDSQLRTLRNWVWLEVYILYWKFRSTNSVIMVDNDMYLKMNITSKALTFDLWCAVLPMLCRLLCIPCFVTKLNALSLC